MAYQPITSDPLRLAEQTVLSAYGDTVSVAAKKKSLNKFGRNETVGTTFETIAVLQGTTANETYVTTNIVDSIVSDSASDTTQTIVVEGHTVDGSGNLTFVSQEKALNPIDGQTEETLTTPLCRVNRMYVKPTGTAQTYPAALVGNVYVYDNTGGIAAGVPSTASATKCMISAGETQSEKCATSLDQSTYWFITEFYAGVGSAGGSAARARFVIEYRDVANGGAWRPIGTDIVLVIGGESLVAQFLPYLIIPKNHDVRVRALVNANTAELYAQINGYLAGVQP